MRKHAQPYIVAEVSKNWVGGEPLNKDTKILSEQFEEIILYWSERGYRLSSYTFDQVSPAQGEIVETIIAVFEYGNAQR